MMMIMSSYRSHGTACRVQKCTKQHT